MTGKDTVDAHPEPNNHNDDRIRYIQFSDRMFKPPHPEQEPEYIITEKKLFEWILQGKITKAEANPVRARPYPVPSQTRCPPPGCPCNRYATCKECVEAQKIPVKGEGK